MLSKISAVLSQRMASRLKRLRRPAPGYRPERHRLLDHLREGDTVVVWKLDRLSRSLKNVLHIMERIGS